MCTNSCSPQLGVCSREPIARVAAHCQEKKALRRHARDDKIVHISDATVEARVTRMELVKALKETGLTFFYAMGTSLAD